MTTMAMPGLSPMSDTAAQYTGARPVNLGARRPTGMQPLGQSTGMTPFTATNNLVGTQITPTNSAPTQQAQNWTTQSGGAYNGFQLQPFKSVAPLDLSGANGQMQGLSYDFNPANAQYGAAQNTLKTAATGAGGYLSQAASMASGNLSGGAGYAQAADTGRARALTMQGLEGLQGPDRVALAGDALKLLEERSQPGYDQSLRSVNQKAAAMGRRGSGVTTNELGDVTLARERELALARRDAANTAAGQTLSDKLNVVNANQGVAQGFGGMDQNAASINDAATRATSANALQGANLLRGIGGDVYGMGKDQSGLAFDLGDRYGQQARDTTGLGERKAGFAADTTRDTYSAGVNERNTARTDEYNQGDFLGSRFDRNAGYLGQREGQDRNNRNEMRDERGYQYGLSRDAVGDEMDRSAFEEQLRNGRYNRGLGYANLGFGADSPAGAYGAQADQYSQNSADGYGLLGAGAQFAGSSGGRRRSGAGSGARAVSAPQYNGYD